MAWRSPAQAANNLELFRDSQVAQSYWGPQTLELFPSERRILSRIDQDVRGGSILDLGVGGGRTTPYLLSLGGRYVGVDFSRQMIAMCRQRFPDVSFLECDARALDAIGAEQFEVVLFSFNGIDYVDDQDRQTITEQVFLRLRPGGLFWFSSHNLDRLPPKPWHPAHYRWNRHPRHVLRTLGELFRNTRHYWLRARTQQVGNGYAILVDEAHEFRCVSYFVDPSFQVRQLESLGFIDVRVCDFAGTEYPVDAPEIRTSAHVHYLAKKPLSAED